MTPRLAYLDNLKILLVVGVIALHTAITYGFDGSWYLESYDEMTGAVVDVLTVVLGTGWLFGLGLFFLIAGYLTGPSLDRKGPRRFAKDRLVRCGIAGAIAAPALLTALIAAGFFEGDAAEDRFAGGWHWEAAVFPLAEGAIATCVSLWAIGFFRRRVNHLRPLARRMAPRPTAPSYCTLP